MKIHQLGIVFVSFISLSACVSQQLVDEDNKQIVRDEATGEQLASTRISLALNYLKIGDVTQAKRNLEKAKNFAPNMVQVHTAFAHFYESVKEIDSAKDSFDKALILDSANPDTLNNYGVFLCKQGELAQAERQILKAIAVPTYLRVAQSYENLSICYLDSDDFKKAEFYIEKAIQHSSQRPSSILQMAYIQYAKGDFSEALKYVNHHDTVNRRYTPRSLALSYRLQRKFNDRKKAKGFATLLVNTFPKSPEAKDYITSSLANSEADKLAKRYQKYKRENQPKRRLKFSPNKKPVEVLQASGPLRVRTEPEITERVIATPLSPKATESFVKNVPNQVKPVVVAPKAPEPVVAPTRVVRTPTPVVVAPKIPEPVVAPTRVVRTPTPVVVAPKVPVPVVAPTKVVRNTQQVVSTAPKVVKRIITSPTVTRNPQQVVVSTPKVVNRVITEPKPVNTPQRTLTTEVKNTQRVITKQNVVRQKKVEVEESVEDKIETYSRGKYRVAVQMINNLASKEYIEEIDGIEVLDINALSKSLKSNPVKTVTSRENTNTSGDVLTHTMIKGDNLFRIALGNNVTISSLLAWNNLDLEKASSIKEGDVIYLEDPSRATR